jgi:hypothetical protein
MSFRRRASEPDANNAAAVVARSRNEKIDRTIFTERRHVWKCRGTFPKWVLFEQIFVDLFKTVDQIFVRDVSGDDDANIFRSVKFFVKFSNFFDGQIWERCRKTFCRSSMKVRQNKLDCLSPPKFCQTPLIFAGTK